MRRLMEYVILYIFMGFSYYLMEIGWRGYSHISMLILGGVCGILIGLLNEHKLKWDMYFEKQVLYGIVLVLVLEFITGVLLHYVLKIRPPVWDYSNLPLNLLGQISLVFAPVFIVPISIAIVADDYYRYTVMDEEKPRYRFKLIEMFKKRG